MISEKMAVKTSRQFITEQKIKSKVVNAGLRSRITDLLVKNASKRGSNYNGLLHPKQKENGYDSDEQASGEGPEKMWVTPSNETHHVEGRQLGAPESLPSFLQSQLQARSKSVLNGDSDMAISQVLLVRPSISSLNSLEQNLSCPDLHHVIASD